jgi:hypothetical protein
MPQAVDPTARPRETQGQLHRDRSGMEIVALSPPGSVNERNPGWILTCFLMMGIRSCTSSLDELASAVAQHRTRVSQEWRDHQHHGGDT